MPDPYYGGQGDFETVLDLAEHGFTRVIRRAGCGPRRRQILTAPTTTIRRSSAQRRGRGRCERCRCSGAAAGGGACSTRASCGGRESLKSSGGCEFEPSLKPPSAGSFASGPPLAPAPSPRPPRPRRRRPPRRERCSPSARGAACHQAFPAAGVGCTAAGAAIASSGFGAGRSGRSRRGFCSPPRAASRAITRWTLLGITAATAIAILVAIALSFRIAIRTFAIASTARIAVPVASTAAMLVTALAITAASWLLLLLGRGGRCGIAKQRSLHEAEQAHAGGRRGRRRRRRFRRDRSRRRRDDGRHRWNRRRCALGLNGGFRRFRRRGNLP